VLPVLGFFYGTDEMNDIFSVCMRCGHKILLKAETEKTKSKAWYAVEPEKPVA
jgi:hypothetical protein